jgi:hypothetical protein
MAEKFSAGDKKENPSLKAKGVDKKALLPKAEWKKQQRALFTKSVKEAYKRYKEYLLRVKKHNKEIWVKYLREEFAKQFTKSK